jgi:putative FmdB family regulatory protein
MALYDFRCSRCGLEFEVSRPMAQATDPAFCPVDGAESHRFFTMPMTFSKPSASPRAAPPARPQRGWSHHGHSHGSGTGSHSHGGR